MTGFSPTLSRMIASRCKDLDEAISIAKRIPTIPYGGTIEVRPLLGSMIAPRLVRSFRPADVMAGGLALAAVGYLLCTHLSGTAGPGLLVAGMVLQSIGLAPVFTLTNDIIIGAAPPERAGAAAGISETASELGGALGIALLGSLATAVYGGAFARETLPQALELTAAIGAAMVLVMAVVIVVLLPPVVDIKPVLKRSDDR